jgi:hydroxypyruvate isomerase
VELVAPENWEAAREAGLTVLSIAAPGMKGGLAQQRYQAALIAQIEHTIDAAAKNDIPQVLIFSGTCGNETEDLSVGICANGLRRLAPVARAAKVTLTLENINTGDLPGCLVGPSSAGFRLIEAVGSPSVKMVFDIHHAPAMGEDVEKSILENIEKIAHIHVSGVPGRCFPGSEQDIDCAGLVRDVEAAGYRGYWGQELTPRGYA